MSLIRSSTATSNNFRSPRGIEELRTPRKTKDDNGKFISNVRTTNFQTSGVKTRPQSSIGSYIQSKVVRMSPKDVVSYEATKHQSKQHNSTSAALSPSSIQQSSNTSNIPNFEEADDNVGEDDVEIHRTPSEDMFIFAVTRGHIEDVKRLLNAAVNIEVCNDFHRDATQIAARNGNVAMLKLLSHYGANMKSSRRTVHGDTLFHLAAANGHVEALKYLHSVGAPPDWKDKNGQTSVHVAARRCELHVLTYFHEALNLDFSVVDKAGYKPIDLVPRFDYDSSGACRKLILSATGQLIADIILSSERAKRRSGLMS